MNVHSVSCSELIGCYTVPSLGSAGLFSPGSCSTFTGDDFWLRTSGALSVGTTIEAAMMLGIPSSAFFSVRFFLRSRTHEPISRFPSGSGYGTHTHTAQWQADGPAH